MLQEQTAVLQRFVQVFERIFELLVASGRPSAPSCQSRRRRRIHLVRIIERTKNVTDTMVSWWIGGIQKTLFVALVFHQTPPTLSERSSVFESSFFNPYKYIGILKVFIPDGYI